MSNTWSLKDLDFLTRSNKEKLRVRRKCKGSDWGLEIEVSYHYSLHKVYDQGETINIYCDKSFAVRRKLNSGNI